MFPATRELECVLKHSFAHKLDVNQFNKNEIVQCLSYILENMNEPSSWPLANQFIDETTAICIREMSENSDENADMENRTGATITIMRSSYQPLMQKIDLCEFQRIRLNVFRIEDQRFALICVFIMAQYDNTDIVIAATTTIFDRPTTTKRNQ